MDKRKIIKVPRPEKGEIFTYLILNDVHSHHSSKSTLQLAYRFFKTVPIKQRKILLLGDILDFGWLMKKDELFKASMKFKDFDGHFCPEMDREMEWFDNFYSDLAVLVEPGKERIYFVLGNHCERIYRPEFVVPLAYQHNFNLFKRLKCEKRDIRLFAYNTFLEFEVESEENLLATHGIYCGSNPIKKHIDACHKPICFGHTHEKGIQSFKNVEGTFMGHNLPCACDMDPVYLGMKPTNWSQGFSILNVDYHNWWLDIFTVKDGKIITPWGAKLRA